MADIGPVVFAPPFEKQVSSMLVLVSGLNMNVSPVMSLVPLPHSFWAFQGLGRIL
jgi:hypothetical protein